MAFRTFGDLNDELKDNLDLEGEDFIDDPELIRLWNRAVAVAEAHMITLGLKDKYFLAKESLSAVFNQEEYDLPATLLGNKILKIIYRDGATFYTVKPLESQDMFENYVYLNNFTTTDFYRYMITHTTPSTQKLLIVPKVNKSVTDAFTIWFSRRAQRYTADSDICDFPDLCYEFLQAFVREKVYEKESHANFEGAKADRMEKEQLMQSALSGQITDSQMSVMEQDLSAYQESS